MLSFLQPGNNKSKHEERALLVPSLLKTKCSPVLSLSSLFAHQCKTLEDTAFLIWWHSCLNLQDCKYEIEARQSLINHITKNHSPKLTQFTHVINVSLKQRKKEQPMSCPTGHRYLNEYFQLLLCLTTLEVASSICMEMHRTRLQK